MCKCFRWLLLLSICISCNDEVIYSRIINIDQRWERTDKKHFDFHVTDVKSDYQINIIIRNNQNYKYSNLFLITTLQDDMGNSQKDTLEYAMAYPDGKLMGEGYYSLKTSKLLYADNYKFLSDKPYSLTIEYATRKNGNVQGDEALEGVDSIGLEVVENKMK